MRKKVNGTLQTEHWIAGQLPNWMNETSPYRQRLLEPFTLKNGRMHPWLENLET
jgi:hypothetical protein